MEGSWSIDARPAAKSAETGALRPVPSRASGWGLPDLTGLFRGYAHLRARQLAAQPPVATQENQLLALVRKAAGTKFGQDHGFDQIRSVADYQARVPLRVFNELWNDYWKHDFPRLNNTTWPGLVEYFAVSSGTSTGKVKHIPVTSEMIRSNYKAASDVLVHHLVNRPKSRMLAGKTFVFGGSTDLVKEAPGVFSGDMSGIAAKNRALWAKPYYFPPSSEARDVEWADKMAHLAPQSLGENIRAMTGGCNWLLLFFEHLAAMYPEQGNRIVDFYPDMEILVHGGVSMAPYRQRFDELLEGSHAELREVYPASEGFIAVADRGSDEGLRMVLDHGVFYEFVPVDELGSDNPTRHWVGNLETGIDYALVLTSCAGLWSYVIGDVVRLVDREIPRLLVTGRTAYFLTTFGEHITGELLESSLIDSAKEMQLTISEFSVGTQVSQQKGELGRHVHVIEFREGAQDQARAEALAVSVDRTLAQRNEDYRERRAVDGGIQPPLVVAAAPGAFNNWMKSRGKFGGQNKVPRVIGNPSTFDDLLQFVSDYNASAGGPDGAAMR